MPDKGVSPFGRERSCRPPKLFSNDHLGDAELQQLRQGAQDFLETIEKRQTKSHAPAVPWHGAATAA